MTDREAAMKRSLVHCTAGASLVIALLAAACEDPPKPTQKPPSKGTQPATAASSTPSSASAPATKPLPPLKLETFEGLGLTFQYPQPYEVETATKNPEVHQIALDHSAEPGVLTVRFNPKKPREEIDLEQVAEAARHRMGPKATVEKAKLEVSGKVYEARAVRARHLGLVGSVDVMAVVPMGDTSYVVLTHVSDDDVERAQRLFDTVLGSLKRMDEK